MAVFGENDISGDLEPRKPLTRNVRRVIVHRQYDAATFENDLALLELESPVKFDAHIGNFSAASTYCLKGHERNETDVNFVHSGLDGGENSGSPNCQLPFDHYDNLKVEEKARNGMDILSILWAPI